MVSTQSAAMNQQMKSVTRIKINQRRCHHYAQIALASQLGLAPISPDGISSAQIARVALTWADADAREPAAAASSGRRPLSVLPPPETRNRHSQNGMPPTRFVASTPTSQQLR